MERRRTTGLWVLALVGGVLASASWADGGRLAANWEDAGRGAVRAAGPMPPGCARELGAFASLDSLSLARLGRRQVFAAMVVGELRDRAGVSYIAHGCPYGGIPVAVRYAHAAVASRGFMRP